MAAFLQELAALPPAPPKTVRFFDRRDFLSVYGADALHIATTFNKTTAGVRTLGDDAAATPALTVSQRLVGSMQAKLVEQGWSFEVWAQSGGKGSEWAVVRRGSPGNFEDEQRDDGDAAPAPRMVALQVGAGAGGAVHVGLAYVDQLALAVALHEWVEADAASLSGAEAALVQVGARECLVSATTLQQHPQLRAMLARADVVLTERKGGDFKGGDAVEADLRRLLEPAHVPQLGSVGGALCRAALGAVLRELDVMGETQGLGRYRLEALQLAHHMRLDAAAVRALNLMPGASDSARSQMHVYGRLNACRTAMGSRRLLAWLRAPVLDAALLQRRHDCVAALVADAATREQLRGPALRHMPDVQRLLARFSRGKAGLPDVMRLYQAVQGVAAVAAVLSAPGAGAVGEQFAAPLAAVALQFANFTNMVESTLDLAAVLEGQYRIRPTFDEALTELHAALQAQMRDMKAAEAKFVSVCAKAELEQRQGTWAVRVPKKDAAAVASKVKGAEEVTAALKGAHYYTTPALRAAGEAHTQLAREYDAVQAGLVAQLLDVVRGYAPLMAELQGILSDLDVYAALAHVAAASGWVRPAMTPLGAAGATTQLLGMRHPCLEAQDGLRYVANDVHFVRGERELILVTGPNMGGKSTHIRAAALCVLLAQCGSFVPCAAATVAVADAVLCRVGAGDSLVRGVSTFMAEMAETALLLRVATQHSLLIVDELGRGTSTYDGFGLATAIAEHVATQLHCFCFFATHFHELTHLAHRLPCVANQHVAAQTAQDELVLLYQVREGPCDQSFGIHVAELARFPPRVVAMARRKARQLESFDVKRRRVHGAEDGPEDEQDHDVDATLRREGEQQLVHFVEAVKNAGPDVNMARLEELRVQLMSQGNAYVQRVLAAKMH